MQVGLNIKKAASGITDTVNTGRQFDDVCLILREMCWPTVTVVKLL